MLHYTITVYNNGAVPATGVTLNDAVPANTTYVADSLTLNGLPVGRPDGGGARRSIAGIPDQLLRPHAAAAGPRWRHADARRRRR